MNEESWIQFIQKARKEYYRIGAVPCPAFNGEPVYFNKYGWSHLLRKGKYLRQRSKQLQRIELIPQAILIIRSSTRWTDHRVYPDGTQFWSFTKKHNNKIIKVVVRQYPGRKMFFSVMNNK